MTSTITQVPSHRIVAGNNDRKSFDPAALEELAASIQRDGLAQHPTLRPVNGHYEIVAGERRVRAMRDILHWDTIPAFVEAMDDERASALMLAENTGRKDLNPIEEAEAYQARIDRFAWPVERIAETAGVSTQRVSNMLDLLTLVPDIQHFIRVGQFPEAYARLCKNLDNNRQRIALRLYNQASNMPLLRWRDIINRLLEEQQAESQMTLFDLESMLMGQVADMEDVPVKGRRAITGAKAARNLPPVRVKAADSMSPILDRYIRDLQDSGMDDAAGAVANIYNLFVSRGWVTVRTDAELPRLIDDAGRVEDELHVAAIS